MIKGNSFDVGKMHIELFLPSETVREGIVLAHPTHGLNIAIIQLGDENLEDCDATITENHNLSLGIRTADCAAICLSDGKKVGIAHVGWRGLCLGFIEKVITHFDTSALDVYVAPFLHSFEIQRDSCYECITQKFGDRYFEEKSGKLFFNFKDAISSLLPPQTVYDARDTKTDIPFPSHRRDGTKDRFVTVVSFR